MNVKEIKKGNWIYTAAIFGERAYKVLGIVVFGHGVEVKTSYGTATFSILLGNNTDWRWATQSDLQP